MNFRIKIFQVKEKLRKRYFLVSFLWNIQMLKAAEKLVEVRV